MATRKEDTTTAPRPQTWDHLRSRKKPMSKKYVIVLDSAAAEELEEATSQYELKKIMAEAHQDDNPNKAKAVAELDQASTRLDAAKVAAEAESVTFVFRSIGRKKYEQLVNACPATPEQVKKEQEKAKADGEQNWEKVGLEWDPDVFPIQLIAASMVSPEMTFEEVQEMWDSDDWSGPETMGMFTAAMIVNNQRKVVDLGKG